MRSGVASPLESGSAVRPSRLTGLQPARWSNYGTRSGSKEHSLAAGQELRPAVAGFALSRDESAAAGVPPAVRHLLERSTRNGGEDNHPLAAPTRPREGAEASPSVSAAPPFTETFFNFPPAKKPSHWPSGEKKGLKAPSVPGMGLGLQAIQRPQIKLLSAALGAT